MLRSLPMALEDHLQGSVTSISQLVLLTRTDGVQFGFTNADREIVFGGVAYSPIESIGTTAVRQTIGTGVDNLDVLGVLTDDRITEEDLGAGVYDNASLRVMIVNRRDLSMGSGTILKGFLGEVELTDGAFRVEVRGLAQRLKMAVGDTTSATCRCRRLGDLQCKVNLLGNSVDGKPITRASSVYGVASATVITAQAASVPSGWYTAGVLRMTGGRNAGQERDIKAHAQVGGRPQMTLRDAFPWPVLAGDSCELVAGCDGTMATCDQKFGNANNFHGEDKLPTNDKIAQLGRPPQ